MTDFRVQLKTAPSAPISTTLAVDVAAPDHRQAVATAEAFVARDHGAGTFLAFTVVALAGDGVDDGYDTPEETAIKNVIHKAMAEHLETAEGVDLVELAGAVLEALTDSGVAIPPSISDPYSEDGGAAARAPRVTMTIPMTDASAPVEA